MNAKYRPDFIGEITAERRDWILLIVNAKHLVVDTRHISPIFNADKTGLDGYIVRQEGSCVFSLLAK